MAKNRFVNTQFWRDDYINNLDPSEKLLFLYFITNPDTNICGIYQIPKKIIVVDTGFDKEMIDKIIKRFEKDGKILYRDGWVAIKNFIKHTNSENIKVKRGVELALELAPEYLKKWVMDETSRDIKTDLKVKSVSNNSDSDSDSDSDFDLNTEIYKRIIDGFYQYHNKQYKFDGKERGAAKRLSTLLSKDKNWEQTLKIKINGLLKKIKENSKFWAFTIPKLEYGWNEFIVNTEQEVDLDFINSLDFRNKK